MVAALRAQAARGEVTVLDGHARTARQAAHALGIDVAEIANSLLFQAHHDDGRSEPVLVLTSGVHRVDTIKVAELFGLQDLVQASPEFVLEHSGFVIGGVPPLAHLTPPLTVVDVSLSRYEQVWAAAGHPRAVFPTSYDELLRLTAGQPAEVA